MSSASDVLAKVAVVGLIDRNHWHRHAMRHAPTMVPRWMPCMLLPVRWVGPERAGVVQAWGESMAAEEDSEECTCKLLSTITQTTSSGGAKVPDGVPPHV